MFKFSGRDKRMDDRSLVEVEARLSPNGKGELPQWESELVHRIIRDAITAETIQMLTVTDTLKTGGNVLLMTWTKMIDVI